MRPFPPLTHREAQFELQPRRLVTRCSARSVKAAAARASQFPLTLSVRSERQSAVAIAVFQYGRSERKTPSASRIKLFNAAFTTVLLDDHVVTTFTGESTRITG